MRVARSIAALAAVGALCGCPSQPPSTGDAGGPCDAGLCGTACVDLRVDSQHCGSCDVMCPADQACAGGRCYPTSCGSDACAQGDVCISGFCVDRECFGVTCPQGELCARGACLPSSCGGMACGPLEVCSENRCVEATCVGVLCPAGSLCRMGLCIVDTCGDGQKNGAESDQDCGGDCPACPVGSTCNTGSDCDSRACTSGVCRAPSCSDGVRNQGEGDADCAGPCASLCADGKTCSADAQCQSGA